MHVLFVPYKNVWYKGKYTKFQVYIYFFAMAGMFHVNSETFRIKVDWTVIAIIESFLLLFYRKAYKVMHIIAQKSIFD